jgi:dCTP deaminase
VAFWSGERLKDNVGLLGIVDPFDPGKIDCSAYTLTLGPESFVTPDVGVAERENVKQSLLAPFELQLGGEMRHIPGGELVIPPGQFAYLLTEEFVRIPQCTMGFISLKFGVKGLGLINVSGFHVDPGFQGRLIFSVYNAGPSPIHLARGQDVFLLWIADLDRISKEPYVKKIRRDPQVNIPLEMVAKANRSVYSLQQLSQKLEDLDRELQFFKRVVWVLATLLTAGISLGALILAGVRFSSEVSYTAL